MFIDCSTLYNPQVPYQTAFNAFPNQSPLIFTSGFPASCYQNFQTFGITAPYVLPFESKPAQVINTQVQSASEGPGQANLLQKAEPVSEAVEVFQTVKTSEKKPAQARKIKSSKRGKPKMINRRNIYKSLVRTLTTFSRKHQQRLINDLVKEGYAMCEIRDSLVIVDNYKELDKNLKSKNKFQKVIEGILAESSIFASILRESLKMKMASWEIGRHGKIASHNFSAYKRIYLKCLKMTAKQIETPMAGNTKT